MSTVKMDPAWDGWPHIRELARRLWQQRAAVMVGAGVSRNATPMSVGAEPFPLWSDVATAFCRQFQQGDGAASASIKSLPTEALADRYEAMFGRGARDELLSTLIPDASYEPGPLHVELLRLPWVDVFTTNYDTLLERAAESVVDIKYSIVRGTADLASVVRPRLFKLHGSVNDTRMVVGLEDYRRYPQDFAPFVNAVQQSMLENSFCLVGFSGADPNFIRWWGWVRDNLGDQAPPIYLCGSLNLDQHERVYLQRNGIRVLDFSSLVHGKLDPHTHALELFFQVLRDCKPPSPLHWPSPAHEASSDGHEEWPGSLAEEERRMLARWRASRTQYPGWIVPPGEILRTLDSRFLRQQIYPLLSKLPGLQSQHQAPILFELEWQRRLALQVLDLDYLKVVVPLVLKLLPEQDAASASVDERLTLDLALLVLQHCRALRFEYGFKELVEALENQTHLIPTNRNLLVFERCQWALDSLDSDTVIGLLPLLPDAGDPEWMGRKAALMAEVGDHDAAIVLAGEALLRSRKGKKTQSDVLALSLEGWLMLLVDALRRVDDVVSWSPRDVWERWQILAMYRCNPRTAFEVLRANLMEARETKPPKETFVDFDGDVRSALHFGSDMVHWLTGVGFMSLEFMSFGFLPPRVAGRNTDRQLVNQAAARVAPANIEKAFLSVVRGGDEKGIDRILDRARVAAMDQSVVERLLQLVLTRLDKAIGIISQEYVSKARHFPAWQQEMESLSEAASRLVIRARSEQRLGLASIALKLFRLKKAPAQDQRILHACANQIFSRTLQILDDGELRSVAVDVLALPLPEDGARTILGGWREPTYHLPVRGLARCLELEGNMRLVVAGLLGATGRSDIRRAAALYRIWWIHAVGWLHVDDRTRFAAQLWEGTDFDQLPAETDFYPHMFAEMPAPHNVDVKSRLKRYVLDEPIPNLVEKADAELGMPEGAQIINGPPWKVYRDSVVALSSAIRPNTPAPLDEAECGAFLVKWQGWWEANKAIVKAPQGRVLDLVDAATQTLAEVCLVRLRKYAEIEAAGITLEDVSACGGTSVLLPRIMLSRGEGDKLEKLGLELRHQLLAGDQDDVHKALQSVRLWLLATRNSEVPRVPSMVLEAVVGVLFRKDRALATALEIVSQEVQKQDSHLDGYVPDVLVALGVLATSTTAPTEMERLFESGGIHLTLRPSIRSVAARLAFFLHRGGITGPAIDQWKSIAESDTLPEVRDAWRLGDSP